jgi:hypothetical protein
MRLVLGSNSGLSPAAATSWVVRHMPILGAMANVSLALRANATAQTPPGVTRGLIWGSPEHDTCHEPDYYYHNQVWYVRGMIESARLFSDICADYCPELLPLVPQLMAAAEALRSDIVASLALSATFDPTTGSPVFVPPLAAVGIAPFGTSTLGLPVESTICFAC